MDRVRRPPPLIAEALRAREDGEPRSAVASRLRIPRSTLSGWERRGAPRAALALLDGHPVCTVCGHHHEIDAIGADYAYLLGVYLGDGFLVAYRRTTALKVALDAAYPGIVEEVGQPIATVRGQPPHVLRDKTRAMDLVTSYWRAWPCLFPQHGPGRKHSRPIVLVEWQRDLVDREPGALLRGLIQTDGWRGENRVVSKGREYSYPRYRFSNRSDDIRQIFTDGCDRLGIAWRPWGRWHISVARRDAVAQLDQHVGPKR